MRTAIRTHQGAAVVAINNRVAMNIHITRCNECFGFTLLDPGDQKRSDELHLDVEVDCHLANQSP